MEICKPDKEPQKITNKGQEDNKIKLMLITQQFVFVFIQSYDNNFIQPLNKYVYIMTKMNFKNINNF